MALITLMTDFGLKDGFVGVMKGVILSLAPQVQIVDLSHLITPQNIREAAIVLHRAVPYFPEGAIHVVVVDPGVGTARRPLAAQLGSQYFVGPDNGEFTLVLERAERANWAVEMVCLDQPQYWLAEISHVFHGRDIFSPVAAHLANGVPLRQLGTPIADPVRLDFPQPERTAAGWRGKVTVIDHFGNLAVNIRPEHLEGQSGVVISVCGTEIRGLVRTFGDKRPGELAALFGSSGDLVIAEVNGNAAQRLNAQIGDAVEIEIR